MRIKPKKHRWIKPVRLEQVSTSNVLQEHFDERVNCSPKHTPNDSKFVRKSPTWLCWDANRSGLAAWQLKSQKGF